jgi:hypothetical protein
MYLLVSSNFFMQITSETKQRKRLVVYSCETKHERRANTHHSKVKNVISTHGDMDGCTLVPGCFEIHRSQTLAEGQHCLMKLGTGGGRWHLVPSSSRPSSISISCMPRTNAYRSPSIVEIPQLHDTV